MLRPKQWLKNVLIFFPAFFSLSILDVSVFIQLIGIFVGFCCIASSIYIFNDLFDIKGDLLHPEKKNRPIASGKITSQLGAALSICLFLIGTSVITLFYSNGFYFCLTYALINIIYSLGAKHIAILDILLVSIGFLIRIYLGGYAIDVPISWWLSLLIFLMSIYILIAKRKDDVLNYNTNKNENRKYIHFYKKVDFKIVLYILSIIIIITYSFYTFSDSTIQLFNTRNLWLTIPIATIGLFYFTKKVNETTTSFEPISLILKTPVIVISLIIWITLFGWLIYG